MWKTTLELLPVALYNSFLFASVSSDHWVVLAHILESMEITGIYGEEVEDAG